MVRLVSKLYTYNAFKNWAVGTHAERLYANNFICARCGFSHLDGDNWKYCPECGKKILPHKD